ncbi:MFS transporter [Rhizobium sp. CG4]|uniref:MFS transporter n=1 Tax=Rhizobium sp. CG4 TaxID=2726075 RepID=UPI00203447C1|nr:MFS transporter [Rhizobium sp. CG4]MCM2456117.1 MFS transporter [Rhizobium sp. CG4]
MQAKARWGILAIVSSALFMIVIDMTVLYTALPRLTHELMASSSEKLWIVNVYALTVAGLLPASGALGDKFGARLLFLIGLIIFGAASLFAAFSPNPEMLIAGRALLAVGAAMMMPATLSIIRQTFTEPGERAFAIGVWAAVASGGAAFGPVIGGVLLEHFWWGSVFLINLPIVAVAFVATILFVGPGLRNPERSFDIISAVQIMIGLVSSTYAVKELAKQDISLSSFSASALLGLVFLVLFARRQRHIASPLIDFSLFANRNFLAGVIAAAVASAALLGFQLAVTQRFQLVLDMSPLEAGLMVLPIPLGAFIAGPLAGILVAKVGERAVMWLSMAIAAASLALYYSVISDGLALQVAALFLMGIGLGATMTAASTAIMLNAPDHHGGMAALIEEVSFELGGAIGIATLGSVLAAVYSTSFEAPVGINDGAASARDGLDAALLLAERVGGNLAIAVRSAAETAFGNAFAAVLITAVVLLGATSIVVRMLAQHKHAD